MNKSPSEMPHAACGDEMFVVVKGAVRRGVGAATPTQHKQPNKAIDDAHSPFKVRTPPFPPST